VARPCKSAALLTEKSQTKAEIEARKKGENAMKGSGKSPSPPTWLTQNQKKLFRFIVKELAEADILCKLDTWILQECVIAIDCLTKIEQMVNEDNNLMLEKSVLSAKDKYTKILFRCCNELSLSPQSRAKIANIAAKPDDGTELLRRILAGDDDI